MRLFLFRYLFFYKYLPISNSVVFKPAYLYDTFTFMYVQKQYIPKYLATLEYD